MAVYARSVDTLANRFVPQELTSRHDEYDESDIVEYTQLWKTVKFLWPKFWFKIREHGILHPALPPAPLVLQQRVLVHLSSGVAEGVVTRVRDDSGLWGVRIRDASSSKKFGTSALAPSFRPGDTVRYARSDGTTSLAEVTNVNTSSWPLVYSVRDCARKTVADVAPRLLSSLPAVLPDSAGPPAPLVLAATAASHAPQAVEAIDAAGAVPLSGDPATVVPVVHAPSALPTPVPAGAASADGQDCMDCARKQMHANLKRFLREEVARATGVDYKITCVRKLRGSHTRLVQVQNGAGRALVRVRFVGRSKFRCKYAGDPPRDPVVPPSSGAAPAHASASGDAPAVPAASPAVSARRGAARAVHKRAAKATKRTARRTAKSIGGSLLTNMVPRVRKSKIAVRARKSIRGRCKASGSAKYGVVCFDASGARSNNFTHLVDVYISLDHTVVAHGNGHVPLTPNDLSRVRTLPSVLSAFDAAFARGAGFKDCRSAASAFGLESSSDMTDTRFHMTESVARGHHRAAVAQLLGNVRTGHEDELIPLLKTMQEALGGFFAFRYPRGSEVVKWCAGPDAACAVFQSQSSDRWMLVICGADLGELANDVTRGRTDVDTAHGVTTADLVLYTGVVTDVRRCAVPAFWVLSASEDAATMNDALCCLRSVIPRIVDAALYVVDDSGAHDQPERHGSSRPRGHWRCAVMEPKRTPKPRLSYMDSMGWARDEELEVSVTRRRVSRAGCRRSFPLQHLLHWARDEWFERTGQRIDTTGWEKVNVNVPRQHGSRDCGATVRR